MSQSRQDGVISQSSSDGVRSRPCGVFVGLATLDVMHLVDHAPGPNQKVTARQQFVAAGGPAANAAVTFVALGGRAVLVTAVGRGKVADLIRADLAEFGVDVVDAVADVTDRAPLSSITVDAAGDRTIVSVDGGGTPVPALDHQRLLSVVDEADVVLVDGHHPALGLAAARRATEIGIPVVVDAGRWKPVFDELLPLDPEFVCSADLRAPGSDSAEGSADALRRCGVTTVVTTRGGEPVRWWHGEQSGEVPVPTTRAVDTLGAGDAFHGAYARARVGDRSVADRLALAAGVASTRVSVPGPRSWLSLLPREPWE